MDNTELLDRVAARNGAQNQKRHGTYEETYMLSQVRRNRHAFLRERAGRARATRVEIARPDCNTWSTHA